ncbi:hypothetical protein RIF29_18630 [Crotalaria pallida]|uniref:Uncharacterized protein n=1 Tax=Crotalaria pallida TaxID=3830 RepID=A0AAN9EYI6_CROPI
MRHVQIADTHYFVGGLFLGPGPNLNLEGSFSNQIHEFHGGNLNSTHHHLVDPKVVLVANLKGNLYLLHHCEHPPAAPTPPPLFHGNWPREVYCPTFPVFTRFVVDNKWLVCSTEDYAFHIFTHHAHGQGEWTSSVRLANAFISSFLRCRKYMPTTALCLFDLTLHGDGMGMCAVFLAIFDDDCELDSVVPWAYQSLTSFGITRNVCAFPISKSSFQVNCFQELRELIQSEVKTPADPTKSCKFLNVSPVKKLVFRLEDKKDSIFDAFILPPGIVLLPTIVLYCIALHCIALHCIALHCIALYCIVLDWICIALHWIVLYCIVLYCIVLYCIVLYCIVLYWIGLDWIGLHCIALDWIGLDWIGLYWIGLYCIGFDLI